jgi:hypothetical protein
LSASSDELADAIVQLFQFSPAQARNAYSAVLLLPGVGMGVRFHPLLTPYKRRWNTNVEKYGVFWDPLPILRAMAQTPLAALKADLRTLRAHLIVTCRLLCLYRSIDLANLRRCVSVVDGIPFIQIKRKGRRCFKWERVVSLPQIPQVSPFHLIQEYVALTRRQAKSGGPVLLTLKAPFRPLKADSVASVTKGFLESHGVCSSVWGPHSTRGAGVGLLKRLGLTAEEVCEIGQWKNVEAFTAHYQRLGAQARLEEKLGTALGGSAQLTSHRGSAEPEVSRTPPRSSSERGGRDTEGEAPSLCEPTHPTQLKRSRSVSSQSSEDVRPSRRRRSSQSANFGKKAALKGKSLTKATIP